MRVTEGPWRAGGFGDIFGDVFGDIFGGGRAVVVVGLRAGPICATTWRYRWNKLLTAIP